MISPVDGVMIPDYTDRKHDYSFARDRQLQNKLLAADDIFDQTKQTTLSAGVHSLRHGNLKDSKFCEVTGWFPDEKLVLRRPEHDSSLSKPRTSIGPREYALARDRSKKESEGTFSFHHYPESHRYIEQYRREHTCTDSTNSASTRNEFLELQRFYAYKSQGGAPYTHPTTVGYPPQAQSNNPTKTHNGVQHRHSESNLRSASRYRLSPSINVRSSEADASKDSQEQRDSPLQVGANATGNTSKMAIHAVSKTPIPKVPAKVTVPANASMISPGLNKTLKASTRKTSSPKVTVAAWESTVGAVRTLDTLACVASPGDKASEGNLAKREASQPGDPRPGQPPRRQRPDDPKSLLGPQARQASFTFPTRQSQRPQKGSPTRQAHRPPISKGHQGRQTGSQLPQTQSATPRLVRENPDAEAGHHVHKAFSAPEITEDHQLQDVSNLQEATAAVRFCSSAPNLDGEAQEGRRRGSGEGAEQSGRRAGEGRRGEGEGGGGEEQGRRGGQDGDTEKGAGRGEGEAGAAHKDPDEQEDVVSKGREGKEKDIGDVCVEDPDGAKNTADGAGKTAGKGGQRTKNTERRNRRDTNRKRQEGGDYKDSEVQGRENKDSEVQEGRENKDLTIREGQKTEMQEGQEKGWYRQSRDNSKLKLVARRQKQVLSTIRTSPNFNVEKSLLRYVAKKMSQRSWGSSSSTRSVGGSSSSSGSGVHTSNSSSRCSSSQSSSRHGSSSSRKAAGRRGGSRVSGFSSSVEDSSSSRRSSAGSSQRHFYWSQENIDRLEECVNRSTELISRCQEDTETNERNVRSQRSRQRRHSGSATHGDDGPRKQRNETDSDAAEADDCGRPRVVYKMSHRSTHKTPGHNFGQATWKPRCSTTASLQAQDAVCQDESASSGQAEEAASSSNIPTGLMLLGGRQSQAGQVATTPAPAIQRSQTQTPRTQRGSGAATSRQSQEAVRKSQSFMQEALGRSRPDVLATQRALLLYEDALEDIAVVGSDCSLRPTTTTAAARLSCPDPATRHLKIRELLGQNRVDDNRWPKIRVIFKPKPPSTSGKRRESHTSKSRPLGCVGGSMPSADRAARSSNQFALAQCRETSQKVHARRMGVDGKSYVISPRVQQGSD